MEISKILYFDEPGPLNTDKILGLAKERIEVLKIHHVIIASDTGSTARKFSEIAKNLKVDILVVTNDKGSKMPISYLSDKYKESKRIKEDYMRKGIKDSSTSISNETLAEFEGKGIRVYFLPDIFRREGSLGLEREKQSIRTKLDPFLPKYLRPLDIEAGADLSLLNIISNGFRVCVGIVAISVRNGLIPEGQIVLSIAGTGLGGGGADTAVVIQAHQNPKACCIKEVLGFPKSK